jgi:pimeloyl-ACP methyl ester carboxylesterase
MEELIANTLAWIDENEGVLSGIVAIGGLVGLVVTGIRQFLPKLWPSAQDPSKSLSHPPFDFIEQNVQFCRAVDGTRIAYAVTGEGPPIVRAFGWFSHLEVEWGSSIGRNFWLQLASKHQLIRYDGRGMGLSEKTTDFSGEHRLADLDAVIEAAGLDRFALLAFSEGARTALRYAARNPERVSHLILHGPAVWKDPRGDEQSRKDFIAHSAMMEAGWGQDSHRKFFADLFLGKGASPDEIDYFMNIQKQSATPEVAVAYYRSLAEPGHGFEIASQLTLPTLILHAKKDQIVPYENGLDLASEIPTAQFKALEGDCHYIMLDTDRSQAQDFTAAVEQFLAE